MMLCSTLCNAFTSSGYTRRAMPSAFWIAPHVASCLGRSRPADDFVSIETNWPWRFPLGLTTGTQQTKSCAAGPYPAPSGVQYQIPMLFKIDRTCALTRFSDTSFARSARLDGLLVSGASDRSSVRLLNTFLLTLSVVCFVVMSLCPIICGCPGYRD